MHFSLFSRTNCKLEMNGKKEKEKKKIKEKGGKRKEIKNEKEQNDRYFRTRLTLSFFCFRNDGKTS